MQILHHRPVGAALSALLLLAAVVSSRAQDCLDYTQWQQPLGEIALPSQPRDLAAEGDFVYVACGTDGLYVIDATNPAAPVVRGHLGELGDVGSADVVGGIVWIGAGAAGLRAVDCSDPAAPALLSTLPLQGSAGQIALKLPYAFVSCVSAFACVVNVADPRAPVVVADLGSTQRRFALAGERLYAQNCLLGLSVYDVSDPTHPLLLGRVPWLGCVGGLAATPSHAYTGTGFDDDPYGFWYQFIAIDFTDPANAALSHSPGHTWYEPYDFAIVDGRLLLASVFLNVFRLDDPLYPAAERRLGATGSFFPSTIAVGDRCVFAGDINSRLVVFDRHALASPPRPTNPLPAVEARDIAVTGALALVATGSAGLCVLDLSNRDQPFLRGAAPTAHPALQVAVGGASAVVLEGTYGLEVFDVSNPDAPVAVGALDTPGDARDIRVIGGYAFVADGPEGLTVVDLRNPASPTVIGRHDTVADAVSLDVSDGFAYLGLNGSDLTVVDVSDPAAPFPRGHFSSGWSMPFVQTAAAGPIVWTSVLGSGLRSFDVSDPDNPRPLGWADIRGSGSALAVSGDIGYLTGNVWLGASWVDVIDLSDATRPRLITRVDLPEANASTAVAVGGRRLLVAAGQLRQLWLDCADPTPVYLRSLAAVREGGVVMIRCELGEALAEGSLEVWRAASGQDRMRLGEMPSTGEATLTFTDSAPSAGEADYWLRAIDADAVESWFGPAHLDAAAVPSALHLYRVAPNPFNPRTTIRFDLPAAGPVRLAVYDLAGRLVRVLVEGEWGAGSYEAVWDGRDSTGHSAPSGSYLARLVAGGRVEVVRMGLVR